ncbi:MAG TPA: hemerythrin domain-containing protein, partial [Ktedonobacterales bacterium]
MSGPGLNQRDAHHAIHQAAFSEAEQLTLLLRRALRTGDQQQALQVAGVLIEHWQTRTLRHAEAEETGWYREILAERPELQTDIIALTRDHELLRMLLAEIQGILSARGIASGVVERFEAMLLLNGIHSREEERYLLDGETIVEVPGDVDGTNGASPPSEPPIAPSDAVGQGAATQHDILAVPVPLAVARPALHAPRATGWPLAAAGTESRGSPGRPPGRPSGTGPSPCRVRSRVCADD